MKCVDDNGYYLTRGRDYVILYEDTNKGFVTVVNDIGRPSEYPTEVFESEENK